MCVVNYGGFPCGHARPEGTIFAVEPCKNALGCKDYTYHIQSIGLDGTRRRCAECQAVLEAMRTSWLEWREYLTSINVPAAACQRAGDNILAAFRERRAVRILTEGHRHRAQDEYPALQTELLREVKAFAGRLQRADEDWDEHMNVLQLFGGPWDGDAEEARRHERRVERANAHREDARGNLTADDDDWDRFLDRQQQSLDHLYEKVLQSDVPARGSPPLV